MNIEQKMEQMANAIKSLEEQLESLIRNEEAMTRQRVAAQAAGDAIRQIKSNDQAATQDTLFNIGGGVFVPTKIRASSKMVLEIESGVAIEKDPEYIVNYLENRIREIGMAIKNNSAEKQKLIEQIQQDRMQLSQVLQSAYSSGQIQQDPSRNV